MAAFEQLYRAHAGALYHRVIRPRVGVPDADDVLVETFVSALEALPRFRWAESGLFGWLARIALNKCHDVGRRAGRDVRRLEALEREPPVAEVPRPDHVAEDRSDRAAARTQVEAVLATLNPRYAQALRLRLLEELSREECAARLGVTLGTFDVVLLRAVRSFRKAWPAAGGPKEAGDG